MNNWIKLTSGVLIYLNKILLNNYVNKKYNQYKYFDFKQDQLQLLFFNKNNKNKKFDNFKKSSQYKRMFEDVSSNSTSHFFKLITFISFLLLYRFYCHIIETTSTYNFFSILKEFCIIFIGIFLILMSWYLILYLKYAILYPSKHFIKIKKLNEKKFKRYCYKNYKFTHYTIYFFFNFFIFICIIYFLSKINLYYFFVIHLVLSFWISLKYMYKLYKKNK